MRRISRKKAWSILSSHSVVVLGHGEATIKETKEVIKKTVELVPDVIESMIEKSSIYAAQHTDQAIIDVYKRQLLEILHINGCG